MAEIPAGSKLIFVDPSVPTKELKSARSNSKTEVYTVEDIKDTVLDISTPPNDGDILSYNSSTDDVSWVDPSSLDIEVGTTPVTSGTDGTLLRNESGIVGDTDYTVPKIDGAAGQVLQTNGAGVVTWQTVGGGGGTPAGSSGEIQFNDSGSFGADSAFVWDNTNKRLGVGASPASTVRLDVRAQGALSTDIAFRVRNSADNGNIFTVSGNNTIKLLADPSATNGIAISAGAFGGPIMTFSDNFSEHIRISAVTQTIKAANFRMGAETGNSFGGLITTSESPAQGRFFRIIDNWGNQWLNIGGSSYDGNSIGMSIRANTNTNANYINFNGFQNINPVVVSDNACVGIGGTSYGTSSKNVIAQYTGTAPTSSPADAFQQYSADITAGNAAPHFRTENGSIIKIYQETTGVSAATLVGGGGTTITDTDTFGGYTLQQIAQALKNLGILA